MTVHRRAHGSSLPIHQRHHSLR